MNELNVIFDGDMEEFAQTLMDNLIANVSNFEKVEIYDNPDGDKDGKRGLDGNGIITYLDNVVTIFYADDVDVADIQAVIAAYKAEQEG